MSCFCRANMGVEPRPQGPYGPGHHPAPQANPSSLIGHPKEEPIAPPPHPAPHETRHATRCRYPENSLLYRAHLVSSPCHDTLRFVASVMPLSPHTPPLSLPRRWLPSCSAPRAHTRCCRTTVNLSAHVDRCAGASALEQPPTKRPRSLPLSLGLPLLTAFTA